MVETDLMIPKIKKPENFNAKISDSTLRDGSQMPGVVIKLPQSIKVFEYLEELGVEKTEIFLYSKKDKIAAKTMLNRSKGITEITGWARANPEDIDLALNFDQIKEVGILMSVSDIHLDYKLEISRDDAREKYLNALQYAVDHGLKPRCHLEDMTRSDLDGFVLPLVKDIIDIAPDAIIRICDTVGVGLPYEESPLPVSIPKIILKLKDLGVKEIETHMHDDFGMAVINSITGYFYGAQWSNLTFLGIGERAGNAELEKVMLFLATRIEDYKNNYNLSKLVEFARYMQREIGIRVPPNKAIVGRNVFAHESGIHTAGVLKNPITYEPYPPELVGGERRILIGSTSGREVVRAKIEETLKDLLDTDVVVKKDDPRVKIIANEIKRLYDEGKRVSCISDKELKAYVEKYFILDKIAEAEMDRPLMDEEVDKEEEQDNLKD
jgi:isopropylmalate/homocitrate/citramalate synthase